MKRTTKVVKVSKPENCPFRYWSTIHYSSGDIGEDDFCSYLKSLDLKETRIAIIADHKLSYEDKVDTSCCCTDEQWIDGCPLLRDNIKIMKV